MASDDGERARELRGIDIRLQRRRDPLERRRGKAHLRGRRAWESLSTTVLRRCHSGEHRGKAKGADYRSHFAPAFRYTRT
jgi:hypothetical protein